MELAANYKSHFRLFLSLVNSLDFVGISNFLRGGGVPLMRNDKRNDADYHCAAGD